MSMDEKLTELEKVISQVLRGISSTKKKKKETSPEEMSSADERYRLLAEENLRLKDERKTVRRRIKAIVREIDKVKW